MRLAHQILRNIGALTAARGVTAVVTFVTTVYLARVLEPAGYGILNWGLAFLAYFNFAADLGLGVYAMREVARSGDRAWTLPGHVLLLRIVGALLTLGVYLSIVALLDAEPLFKLTVSVLGLSIIAHAIELGWVYHGLQRLGVVAVRNVLTSLVTLVGVVLLVRHPEQVVAAAAVIVAAVALPNLWLLLTYGREFGRPSFRLDFRLWWTMLIPALPIAASHLLATINTNVDQLMLGLMRTEVEVGLYAAAYRVLTAATIPWQIVLQAFMPALANAVGDQSAMRDRMGPFTVALYALGMPIAVAGWMLADDIISIFGPEYRDAAGPLGILMVSLVMMYARVAYGGALVAWDRQRSYSVVLGVGAVLNIGLNLVLIPAHGIVGAAVATLVTECAVMIGTAIMYLRLIRKVFFGAAMRVVLATLLGVGLPLWLGDYLAWPLLLQVVVVAAAYAAALVMLRIVPPHLIRQWLPPKA